MKRNIRRAKGKKGYVSFIIDRVRDRTTKKKIREVPRKAVRQAIAHNIHKIEKKFGRFARDRNGNIKKPLGSGSYGPVFRLETPGRVLKITKDQTEAPNALFWKGAQRVHGFVRRGSARVYSVGKIKYKDKIYGLVEREEVDMDTLKPPEIDISLDGFTENLLEFCDFQRDMRGKITRKNRSKVYGISKNLLRESLKSLDAIDQRKNPIAPDLKRSIVYAWKRGNPQYDLYGGNIGTRFFQSFPDVSSGELIIFDYGTTQ